MSAPESPDPSGLGNVHRVRYGGAGPLSDTPRCSGPPWNCGHSGPPLVCANALAAASAEATTAATEKTTTTGLRRRAFAKNELVCDMRSRSGSSYRRAVDPRCEAASGGDVVQWREADELEDVRRREERQRIEVDPVAPDAEVQVRHRRV